MLCACHWWVTHKFWFTAPINIAYTTKHKYVFKDGYFFTVAPGYYKANEYGIRLRNVFEVIDTHDKHFSGSKFLTFRVATLVPFETKLIERTLLSSKEVSLTIELDSLIFALLSKSRNNGWIDTTLGFARLLAMSSSGKIKCQSFIGWWTKPSTFENTWRNLNTSRTVQHRSTRISLLSPSSLLLFSSGF